MSKERLELIDDLADILYADKIEIREFVRKSLDKDDTIDSMAHIIKVKNKEMRELSNFLKERSIPFIDLSPLVTVMDHVQELERVNKQLKGNLSVYKGYYKNTLKHNEELIDQNKRYRDMETRIKMIINRERNDVLHSHKEALQDISEALEESE